MPEVTSDRVQSYLRTLQGHEITEVGLHKLGDSPEERSIKKYGYGIPVLVDYLRSGQPCRAVIHTISPGPFGHEHMADRAQVLLWEYAAFNRLPQHARAMDVGGISSSG
jgi:hypothetical protein